MTLPERMSANLEKQLTQNELLDTGLAKEVIADLDVGKSIKWNLVLAKQLEIEKGGADEADN